MFWNRKPRVGEGNEVQADVEFDIENLPVMSLERGWDYKGLHTAIYLTSGMQWNMYCDEAKHADFLRRFRRKIGTSQMKQE